MKTNKAKNVRNAKDALLEEQKGLLEEIENRKIIYYGYRYDPENCPPMVRKIQAMSQDKQLSIIPVTERIEFLRLQLLAASDRQSQVLAGIGEWAALGEPMRNLEIFNIAGNIRHLEDQKRYLEQQKKKCEEDFVRIPKRMEEIKTELGKIC